MTETTSPMHSAPAGTKEQACAWCPAIFTAKRRWQRFCGAKCRNDYHHWAKPHVVRELRELVRVALEGCDPKDWNPRARKVLGIKPAPAHPAVRSIAETIEKVNADADRRDAVLPPP